MTKYCKIRIFVEINIKYPTMEKTAQLDIAVREFIDRVKADPDAFIAYIKDKPNRTLREYEDMKKQKEAKKQKALNELLSV